MDQKHDVPSATIIDHHSDQTKHETSLYEDIESSPSPAEESSQSYNGKGTPEEKALILKQDLRIIPLCAAIFLLCYLDRSNIGNARVLNASQKDDVMRQACPLTVKSFAG